MATRRALVGPFDERLDRIARAAYGTELGGTVEALLEANPALAEHVASIPAGTTIVVPARVEPEAAADIRPWI